MHKCPQCGYEASSEFNFCPICGYKFNNINSYISENINQTSQSETKTAESIKYFRVINGLYEYPKAPLGKRLGAFFIDGFILFILAIPSLILIFSGYYMSPHSDYFDDNTVGEGSFIGGVFALWGFFLLIIPLIYYFIKDGFKNGQSFGKRIVNLMVVDIQRNKPCNLGKSAFRNLISSLIIAIPFVNFLTVWIEPIMVLMRYDGKKAADLVASTQVINADQYDH